MTPTEILAENNRRKSLASAGFDPLGGDSADPGRTMLDIPGLKPNPVWVPLSMKSDLSILPFLRCKTIDNYIKTEMHAQPSLKTREMATQRFNALRIRHDFPFWAATCVKIKNKGGGEDVPFCLNRPQRKLTAALEEMRSQGKPIRLILLKARQWGGSTCVQVYMAWLQMVHSEGLNSLIVAHQGMATDEIKDMFDRLLESYPDWLFTDASGNTAKGKRMEKMGAARGAFRIPLRNFKVKLASAERPNACRGGDYSLVHCSEVGLWKATAGKQPDDLMRAATAGILLKPMTLIVLESTANGTGNYFHREYESARRGESMYRPLFVAWHEIEQYSLPLDDPLAFATLLTEKRHEEESFSDRAQPGAYLWWLWEKGATLEAINWYVQERRKYREPELMAAEYPSDDVEAFAHSGARVFDKYRIEALRHACRPPLWRGELEGEHPSGPESLSSITFHPDTNEKLWIWEKPGKTEPGLLEENRYIVAVDIGGRSRNADWSVIAVFDRLGGPASDIPELVAQWRGHTDMDILAWNAAKIAAYYHDALLVIESNTLETHDAERFTDGDQSHFILNQIRDAYPNLYARPQSEEEIVRGAPRKYGFHTNVATKPMVISALVKAIREGGYVERDEACLDEFLTYEQRQNGSYGAIAGCHDDLLMTRAIALHISFTQMEPPSRRMASAYRRMLPPSAAVF